MRVATIETFTRNPFSTRWPAGAERQIRAAQ